MVLRAEILCHRCTLTAPFAALFRAYRNLERLGGGSGYALDPVCGMQVHTANVPASVPHDGHAVFFCSDHCRHRFEADPSKNAAMPASAEHDHHAMSESGAGELVPDPTEADSTGSTKHIDPVCGMTMDPEHAGAQSVHHGRAVYFCCLGCAQALEGDPEA